MLPEVTILAAFVVPHGRGDEQALLDWAKQHLAAYKRPRTVVFMDHLPRTRTGKLLRRELPRRVEDIGSTDDPMVKSGLRRPL